MDTEETLNVRGKYVVEAPFEVRQAHHHSKEWLYVRGWLFRDEADRLAEWLYLKYAIATRVYNRSGYVVSQYGLSHEEKANSAAS